MKKWMGCALIAGSLLLLGACNADDNDMMNGKPANGSMNEQSEMKSDDMKKDEMKKDTMDDMAKDEMK